MATRVKLIREPILLAMAYDPIDASSPNISMFRVVSCDKLTPGWSLGQLVGQSCGGGGIIVIVLESRLEC